MVYLESRDKRECTCKCKMATRDKIARLIELLESTEWLWRVESAEYKDRDRKYIAYEKSAEILEWPGMLPDFADNVQLQTDWLRNR